MIRPQKEDFLKTARKNHIIAIVKALSSDLITPVDAFYAVNAAYLLESVEKGTIIGRYSFLGVEPIRRFEINNDEYVLKEENQEEKRVKVKDPLKAVTEILTSRPFIGEGDLSPFPGGAVGYIGYDYVKKWEKISPNSASTAKPGIKIPESVFIVTRYTLIFDNLMHTLKIVCNVTVGDDPKNDYDEAIQGLKKIADLLESNRKNHPRVTDIPRVGKLTSSYSQKDFTAAVEHIKELITQGEAIQVVLSQRLTAEYAGDPFLIFRALRTINPSPYMFYLNLQDFVILGASPEVMVRVDDKKALLRPIAGTRPRGNNPHEDEALKMELLADTKERAEHLMLVDLARNDLGRIAKSGTVSVDRMMEVELYSHVMHIVSEVTAQLQDTATVYDVIKATFPAGTVSGAPKVRAMQIIEELEPVARGPYAGMVGYLSYTGRFDSCITIRSMVVAEKKIYLQAGAGIVYDSVPQREYEETLNKAKALFKALSGEGEL